MFSGTIEKLGARVERFLSRCGYWSDQAGVIATAFAVMAPILVGTTGMALDLGQSFLVRQRLGGALDAAALAATASETDEDSIQERVDQFMQANYPDGKIGDLILDSIDVSVDGDDVTVSASAQYETSFIKVLGIDTLNVAATTTIHRAIKGLEAVLVLDNTGSMGTTNMDYLRTASTNFVNIIFERAQTPTDVKIGIVPYSSSVRIGKYGLGEYPDGGTYGDGDVFVTLPPDVSYTTDHESSTGWYGCVVEHNDGAYDPALYDFTTADYVTGSYGQLWKNHTTSAWDGHGWDPSITTNDPDPYDSTDTFEGPWDIYMYGSVDPVCVASHQECTRYKNGSCTRWTTVCDEYDGYEFNKNSTPNSSCPYAYIQPLTSDQQDLLDLIDTMAHGGSTYSNIGMLWGGRLLSPEAPFTEGAAWDDDNWQKAIVIMTDGEMSPSGTYSTYWDAGLTDVDTVSSLNDRLLETCELLKSQGVIIYTVNFKHATSDISEATKQVYRDCATQPSEDYYRFVTSGEELNEMFEEIATKLARLHISK